MPPTEQVDTVVVGASAAGLATSACLAQLRVPHVLLEQEDHVAHAWRCHYDRLHLHTSRGLSGLPRLPMPRSFPKYPSRAQVIEYLEHYTTALELKPVFGRRVVSVRRERSGFFVDTDDRGYRAERVVIATGMTRKANVVELPDRSSRSGAVLHSSDYHSGAPWAGKRVLVVGLGNSGGEIAIDLVEHGAAPTLSVRGAVNVIPRDVLGIPILAVGIALQFLPARIADALGAPIARARFGDLEALGLRRPLFGPIEGIREHGRIPLIDVGTIRLLREGKIALRPGIDRLVGEDVVFTDGRREAFDAIVLATGYRPALDEFVADAEAFADHLGRVEASAAEPIPGLWLCGFYVSPKGMLRQIGAEARVIARTIAARRS